jgi:hypothetical protein
MILNPQQEKRSYKFFLPRIITTKNGGFIYVVKVGKYLNIGRTKNLSKRLKVYENMPPFKCKVLLAKKVIDHVFYERALQKYLEEFQIKGEWFSIPKQWGNIKKEVLDVFLYIDSEVKKITI